MTIGSETASINDIPKEAALPEAAKLLAEVTKNEETRFSNLNTRAVAVLSATSLITALAGIFSKDVLGKDFTGWGRQAGAGGLVLTVGLLTLTAIVVVLGVLKPGDRLVFGDNDLTKSPGGIGDPVQVIAIAFREYLAISTVLTERNVAKAKALNWAYVIFLAAVVAIAVTTILVVISRV